MPDGDGYNDDVDNLPLEPLVTPLTLAECQTTLPPLPAGERQVVGQPDATDVATEDTASDPTADHAPPAHANDSDPDSENAGRRGR